ncbi:MAG: cation:proton antiporter, partial [Candidatus Woesearchaeota archaeon]
PGSVQSFAFMGVILLMFLAGYEETDIGFLIKKRKRISIISITGLGLTLFTLFVFSKFFLGYTVGQSIFFMFIFGLTDVAVSAKSLLATGHIKSEKGETLLGIAVVDTVIGIVLLAFGITFLTSNSFSDAILTFFQIVLFFIILIFAAKYLPKVIHKVLNFKTELMDISTAFISIFFLAFLAEELKLASVLGAYFAGLILQQSRDLETDHFSSTVKSISYSLFIPVFFAWIVLSIDLKQLGEHLPVSLLIAGVVIVSKFVFIIIASLMQKAKFKESLIYASGMTAKGADNLIVIAIALNVGILSPEVSSLFGTTLVLTMLISVVLSSFLLKYLLKGKKAGSNA